LRSCLVIAEVKDEGRFEFTQLMFIVLAVVISLLSVAVVTTVALVCYYRRRMKAMAGTTLEVSDFLGNIYTS